MCTTATSTYLNYDSPPIVKHCGEVYCSQDLEQFFLNCKSCSQEFNLLSCSFFIKHVRECFSLEVASLLEINTTSQKTVDNAVEISFKNAFESHTPETNEDPLSYMKVEVLRNEVDVPNNYSERDSGDDSTLLSDCQYEDDVSGDYLERRKLVEVVIDEYKKRPVLWQSRDNKAGKRFQYEQMRNSVNARLKKNYTCLELRNQLSNLRSCYSRALKKKDEEGLAPTLWYFHKLSFLPQSSHNLNNAKAENEPFQDFLEDTNQSGSNIEASSYAYNPKLIENLTDNKLSDEKCTEFAEKDEKQDISNEEFQEDGSSEDDLTKSSLVGRELNSKIIEEYKKRPVLWQDGHTRQARKLQFTGMRRAINESLKLNLTVLELRDKIARIRGYYTRILKRKELYQRLYPEREDFVPRLWYFDKLSFLQQTIDDHKIARRKNVSEETMEGTAKSDMNQKEISVKEQNNKTETKTCEDPLQLKEPLDKMQPDIEKERLFPEEVSTLVNQEMKNDTYENSLKEALIPTNLRLMEISNDSSSPLKVENYQAEGYNCSDDDNQGDMGQLSNYQDEDDLTIDNLKRRKLVEVIIDEYRKRPAIWQKRVNQASRNHHFKQMRKAINAKLKKNYTDLELRTRIRRLKSSYRRALQQKIKFEAENPGKGRFTPQLWYFNKFSFLEQAKDSHKVQPDIEKERLFPEDVSALVNQEMRNDTDENPLNEALIPTNQEFKEISNDPSSPLKEEIYQAEGYNCSDEGNQENMGQSFDYQDEDDLTIENLKRRKLVGVIIDEYRKRPAIWQNRANQASRNNHFKQMRKSINAKLKKNYTDLELRTRIRRLKSSYRRALQQKKSYEAQNPGKGRFTPQLWYFNKLSFLEQAKDSHKIQPDIEKERLFPEHVSALVNQELRNDTDENPLNETLIPTNQKLKEISNDPSSPLKEEIYQAEGYECSDGDSQDDTNQLSDYQDEDYLTIDNLMRRKLVEGIIDEYRKRPAIWQNRVNHASRKHHFKQMRKAINAKFRKSYTDLELRTQIRSLRSSYRRALQQKKKFEAENPGKGPFTPQLWYFNKFSFLEQVKNSHKGKSPDQNELDSNEEPKEDSSADEQVSNSDEDYSAPGLRTERRVRPDEKVLSEPKIILEIINQYKSYPFLWDQTANLYGDKYARKDAYHQITKSINAKFCKKVTERELRQQIINLRSVYRRAQRKQHSANYHVSLWYYKNLSFIDNKSDQPEDASQAEPVDSAAETPTVSIENLKIESLDESQECEILDSQHYFDDENQINEQSSSTIGKNVNSITLSIIEEYKRHPCLWDSYTYKTASRQARIDANQEIAMAINSKFNTNFTNEQIRNKIVQLRSSYRRVLRCKEAFEKKHANAKRKFHPQLWYFDKMTFIGAKESDFWVSRRKKQKTKASDGEEDMDVDVDEEEEEEGEEEEKENNESLTEYELASDVDLDSALLPEVNGSEHGEKYVKRNPIWDVPLLEKKNILTAIIEEYKKNTCLWAVKHYTNDNHYRRKAFEQIANDINDRFNTEFSYRDISSQILKLRLTYKRMLRRKQAHQDGEFKTKMWYADLLSFIETKPEDLQQHTEEEVENYTDANNLTDKENKSQEMPCATADENLPQRKNKVPKKEQVFKIIELYKAAPVLWDKNHPRNRQVVERKKAMNQIIATLSQEHDCYLTTEEFRYQIRFLKESYFRTARQEAALKRGDSNYKYMTRPFFYSQMSFLEPFAKKEPTNVPKLQIFTKIAPGEDFTYLTENRNLMLAFIEMYKANNCLWDQKDKDHENDAAHSEAYDKIMDVFLQHDVVLTRDQVLSAISFLHATVVNTQKAVSSDTTNEETAWFYEHLKFLGRIPRFYDKHCDHCDQHFASSKEYEKHKIEIAGDYPYKCFICNAGFVSRSKYAYHQITHKEPHKCEICDFQAYDRHNFNVHMRRHKGIHSYKCEHCDKGFVTSTELTRHLRKHTGEKAFICDICGKSLASNSEFYHHLKRHRNQRDHKCDVCGSAFYTLKTLRDHMASHSTERTHICEVCGAAFKQKKTLNQHKALHLEQKKHECKICGKQFAQKAGVYSHMKSHGLMPGNTN